MKIRSLLLGSVATVGLTTAGFATDLGVVTSLNVCDELGLSGLTISSDDNCLVITGEVKYEFTFGDWDSWSAGYNPYTLDNWTEVDGNGTWDHTSAVDYWLQFTATADSSFGPATATIKLSGGSGSIGVDKAFITIGDTTMLTAGLASSIFKNGDDEPLNFLGLFNSEQINTGVGAGGGATPGTGGHVIQLVSDLGNGIWIGGGLEDLYNDGSGVGVISYSGDGLTAHASVAVGGILTNTGSQDNDWMVHTGFTGTFDTFKIVGAVAAGFDDSNNYSYWNGLLSGSATFDMFTLAGSVEAANGGWGAGTSFGAGGSVGFTVSDGVTLNLGARWFDPNYYGGDDSVTQVAAQIVASVSDDVTLTGEVGARHYGTNSFNFSGDIFYAKAKAAWSPGGGVDASLSGEVRSFGAWQTDFVISKSIK